MKTCLSTSLGSVQSKNKPNISVPARKSFVFPKRFSEPSNSGTRLLKQMEKKKLWLSGSSHWVLWKNFYVALWLWMYFLKSSLLKIVLPAHLGWSFHFINWKSNSFTSYSWDKPGEENKTRSWRIKNQLRYHFSPFNDGTREMSIFTPLILSYDHLPSNINHWWRE